MVSSHPPYSPFFLRSILLLLVLSLSVIQLGCNKGNCQNGVKDGEEIGVDCGGECDPCPTCKDGTQNQNEDGVDCGGACPDCYTTPSCSIPTNSAEYTNGSTIDSYSTTCQVTNDEYTIRGDGNSTTLKVHFDRTKPPKSHNIEVVSSGNQGLLERGECIIYLTISGELFFSALFRKCFVRKTSSQMG